MCGIVIALEPRLGCALRDIEAMASALRHRGPDDEGYLLLDDQGVTLLGGADTPGEVWASETDSRPRVHVADQADRRGKLLMAHRRLAIVDLSAQGHQPMRRGEHLHVVYNGEIYNHVEIRRELEALGHVFKSHSDTEVLLAAYQQWGAEALPRFNGMWAFAIHDARSRTLFVARDRFGVKPLYYWTGPQGQLVFASEIKALLRHPQVQAQLELQACQHFLLSGPEAWTRDTMFAGIRRFPAGHWVALKVDAPQAWTPQPFWSTCMADEHALQRPFVQAEANRLADEYRSLLDDAVRLRMRMDVRFGTALSGGLDSSQIASLVNLELKRRGRNEQQEVFSSVYAGDAAGNETAVTHPALREADESQFIRSVAQKLGVRSNTISARWQEIPDAHERMIWALDAPPANTLMSSWHTYALVAQRGVVVTLDGQGADEQLAGYLHFLRNHLAHTSLPRAFREAFALMRTTAGCSRTVALGLMGSGLHGLMGNFGLRMLGARVARARDMRLTLQQALALDFSTGLQTLLHYADQSAMAWSVESRMPFMDWRVVRFLSQLPYAYRVHDGWTKWLARHAMRDTLPPDVVWRRDKMGWAIPEQAWFGTGAPLNSWMSAQITGSAFACEVAASVGVVPERADAAMRCRLLNLAVWHRLFFEETARPGRRLGRGQS